MKLLCRVLGGVLAAVPALVQADAAQIVNRARLQGCGSASAHVPLQTSAQLFDVARRIANGASLQEAMQKVGYLATQSAELHFTGEGSDAAIYRLLTVNYCRALGDPKLQEMGIERRGAELWIVLGATVMLPTQADAGAINQRILALVNEARRSGRRCGDRYFGPVAALVQNATLAAAALEHAHAMAARDTLDHRGADGSTPAQRVQRAGYGAYSIVGENIAAGLMTPDEVTQGWLASPAHCENIMDGRFAEMGVGYAANRASAMVLYWTQDFASRR